MEWYTIARKDMELLSKELGAEFHYMLVCDHFKQQRQNYIKRYYYQNPNTLKFKQLNIYIYRKYSGPEKIVASYK